LARGKNCKRQWMSREGGEVDKTHHTKTKVKEKRKKFEEFEGLKKTCVAQ